ncbi:MAG: RHS repeat-associated core domain-containing protein [Nanoarchaeota archaeon]
MHARFVFLLSVFGLFVVSLLVLSVFPVGTSVGHAGSSLPMAKQSVPDEPLGLPLIGVSGTTTYVYGSGLVGVKKSSGEISYHVQDVLSTNRLVVSDKGQLESRFQAYPYGKDLQKESYVSKKQKFTYTGKEDDGHLMYFGARYLDARTGRFLGVDPAQSSMANYDYADANPLKNIDPDGNEVTQAQVATWNAAISGGFALAAGVLRGDSFTSILKNTVVSSAMGVASFDLKRNSRPASFLAADVVNSVRSNAIANKPYLGNIRFNLFSPISLDVGLGKNPQVNLDVGRAADVAIHATYAVGHNGRLDIGRSLESLRPVFSVRDEDQRSELMGTGWSGFEGFLGGGAVTYVRYDEEWTQHVMRHELVHSFQSGGDFPSLGRGLGIDDSGGFSFLDNKRFLGLGLDFSALSSNLVYYAGYSAYYASTRQKMFGQGYYNLLPSEQEAFAYERSWYGGED